MAANVLMPKWGLTMKEAQVVRWLKREGDRVEKDEPLLRVVTEKIMSEIKSPASGVLARIIALVGAKVPVGNVVAIIAEPGEEVLEPIEAAAPPAVQESPKVIAPPQAKEAGPLVTASPAVRRLAKEKGIDLAQVTGTGPNGRVMEKDVLAFVESPAKSAAPATVPAANIIPFAGMRQAIAEHMVESLHSMAQLTMMMEVDATELVKLRDQIKADFEVTYTDLLVKAVAKTLKRHPILNATLIGDEVHQLEAIHIGVAVALQEGLIVPVVRDADKRTVQEIAQEVRRLAQGARENTLSVDEVTGSTFSITNLGTFGLDGFTPIINAPEAAILGVGRIVERVVVHDDQIARRKMMVLSLTIDHRLVDGAPGAEFMQSLKELLENPYRLLV